MTVGAQVGKMGFEIDLGDAGARCFTAPNESKSELVSCFGVIDVSDDEGGCDFRSDGES